MCKNEKAVHEVSSDGALEDEQDSDIYNINLFRIKQQGLKLESGVDDDDFKVQLVINNNLDSVLADTGAKISVCGYNQAKKWNLVDRITKTQVKIKPYKSEVIPAIGVAKCAVTFGQTSVPVSWYVIKESCEPVLSGNKAKQLGIIKFSPCPEAFMPVNMIEQEDKNSLQEILQKYPENFKGIGKLRNYEVKLHVNPESKPVAEPPRQIPYHLKERVNKALKEMILNDVIEEHPVGDQAPWVSNIVIAPKDDGEIRITLDAKNVNKAIYSTNRPIPRQEDIKAQLAGSKFFSKLDLKSAFWQLEIRPDSRYLTTFHANDKLYRYKRLVMGLKPAQGELNAALQPLFSHIPHAHILHDDLIIAAITQAEHDKAVEQVMQVILEAGITLNPKKCVFGKSEIKFWGLIVGADGVRPDPEKIEALDHLTPPRSKDELVSFLCMMQSNSEFIPNFSKRAAKLRVLTKKSVRFKWRKVHQKCFEDLLEAFKKKALLQFFDLNLQAFIFVDAHKTGLGAMLAQGSTVEDAKPVAVASRSTNVSEKNYPQIDLESIGVDFGLRRFRNYVVVSPRTVIVVSDHKPLGHIFNSKRKGSVRSQRVKLRHQDIPYLIEYRKGKLNQMDYMSRHAKPLSKVPKEEQREAEELNNLLYTLHTTPIIDHIGLATIAKETAADPVLKKVKEYVQNGKTWIPKDEDLNFQRFRQIMPEITITGNGVLLKGERMILPMKLQDAAIELAHRGTHPGQSVLERRLRYHFFFHDIFDKVKTFVRQCGCSNFVDKKTKEPIKPHKVPQKCWETVSVDLFGPMPSSKHVVVVQDLGSRFPAAKLVTSTKADKVRCMMLMETLRSRFRLMDLRLTARRCQNSQSNEA